MRCKSSFVSFYLYINLNIVMLCELCTIQTFTCYMRLSISEHWPEAGMSDLVIQLAKSNIYIRRYRDKDTGPKNKTKQNCHNSSQLCTWPSEPLAPNTGFKNALFWRRLAEKEEKIKRKIVRMNMNSRDTLCTPSPCIRSCTPQCIFSMTLRQSPVMYTYNIHLHGL